MSVETIVSRVNGALLPVKSPIEGLHIAVRHALNPLQAESPNANPHYYSWKSTWPVGGERVRQSGLVVVDAYAPIKETLEPIGHMDWWLLGDYANGGGNEHAGLIPTAEHEERAAVQWHPDEEALAFRVRDEYQGNGLGSLMLATSAMALPNLGVNRFYSGSLLEPAQNTYARFGIDEDTWGQGRCWSARSAPIMSLSEHPNVAATIDRFQV